MQAKWIKQPLLIAATFVASMTAAHADPYSSGTQSRMSDQTQTTPRPPIREITPDAGPRVAHGADVFITADFIWWKAVQDGLDYSMTGVVNTGSLLSGTVTLPPGVTGKGTVHDPDFGWEPGFKVGLGLNLWHDGWDLYAQYTWLHSSSSDTTTGIGITNSITSAGTSIIPLGDVKRTFDWDLHFNVIDLELGRNFYISPNLMLRPHFGFKGTWQEQDATFKSIPEGGFRVGAVQAEGPYRSHQDHDSWGIGTRAGLNTAWHFTKNWSIFGNVAWTAMWTHYDVDRSDRLTLDSGAPVVAQMVKTELSVYEVRYIGEFQIGLRWEMWFSDDNYHFLIQAGWEQQVWVNNGNFIRLYNDVSGDLNMHGLDLKFRFDF